MEHLHAAIDAPPARGWSEVLSDEDHAGAWSAQRRELDARRNAIGHELDARAQASTAHASGKAARIMAILNEGQPRPKRKAS